MISAQVVAIAHDDPTAFVGPEWDPIKENIVAFRDYQKFLLGHDRIYTVILNLESPDDDMKKWFDVM